MWRPCLLRRKGLERTRFPWTRLWANEAGRSEGIGDEAAEGWPGGRGGDGGGGAADGGGATRAVECACEGGDRAAALEGRGAGDGVRETQVPVHELERW